MRNWTEITTHKYMFDRQDKEIAVLAELKREDMIALFEKVFFSHETKRLELEFTAIIHK
jgi:secreted Zn-dependent insulinase-like peptidase